MKSNTFYTLTTVVFFVIMLAALALQKCDRHEEKLGNFTHGNSPKIAESVDTVHFHMKIVHIE